MPGAFKCLPYDTQWEKTVANAELAGLRDADGCPHIVQCYGVFNYQCPATCKHYIYVIME